MASRKYQAAIAGKKIIAINNIIASGNQQSTLEIRR
jgi:hypothetical protein